MIRDYRPEDRPEIERIHQAQGIDYTLDVDGPLFVVKKVLEVDGKIKAALVLKLCAETMLLLDGEQEPQEKMQEMEELQASVLKEAYDKGLDEIHAAIPEIGFDKRLLQLGWQKDRPGWNLWTRRTA